MFHLQQENVCEFFIYFVYILHCWKIVFTNEKDKREKLEKYEKMSHAYIERMKVFPCNKREKSDN